MTLDEMLADPRLNQHDRDVLTVLDNQSSQPTPNLITLAHFAKEVFSKYETGEQAVLKLMDLGYVRLGRARGPFGDRVILLNAKRGRKGGAR